MVKQQRDDLLCVGVTGLVDDLSGADLILDTNVVGLLYRLGQSGYRDDDLGLRRVVSWLRRVQATPPDGIAIDLGVIENSSYHAGFLNPRTALPSLLLADRLPRLDADQLTGLVESGRPVEITYSGPELDVALARLEQSADALLPMLLGPAYLTVLAAHASRARGADWRTGLSDALAMLARLDYVAPAVLSVIGLNWAGHGYARTRVSNSVLKSDGADLRRSILSGAWDVAVLSLRSYLTTRLGGGRPVIVTDDGALAELAGMIEVDPDGVSLVPDSLFDAERRPVFEAAVRDLFEARQLSDPALPSKELLAELAAPLEAQLGIEPLRYEVASEVATPPVRAEDLADTLRAGALEPDAKRDALVAAVQRPEMMLAACYLVRGLLADNSQARGRSEAEGLEVMIARFRSRMSLDKGSFQLGEQLIGAMLDGTTHVFNGLLGRAAGPEGPAALAYLWEFIGVILEDTAVARRISQPELRDYLIERTPSLAAAINRAGAASGS